MVDISECPSFVGDHWLTSVQGFSYIKEPISGLSDEVNLKDSNDWLRFLCVIEQLKLGNYTNYPLLVDVISTTKNEKLKIKGISALGYTCPKSLLYKLYEFALDESFDIRVEACIAMRYTFDLNLMKQLLKLKRQVKSGSSEYDNIISTLSSVLESEVGDFYDDSGALSTEQYENLALSKIEELNKLYGTNQAYFYGAPLNLSLIVDRLETACYKDDVEEEIGGMLEAVDIIEQMTGLVTLGFFDEGLDPDINKILQSINSLKNSGQLESYKIGQRYFFGHPIPT